MLTIRKQKFIEYVARTGNIVQSYIKAGYSPKSANNNASILYANPEVNKAISDRIASMYDLTQEQWRKQLMDLKDEPKARASDKIRIMEIYGKHRNYLGENVINVTVANLGTNELESIRNKRLSKASSPTLLSDTQAQESIGS